MTIDAASVIQDDIKKALEAGTQITLLILAGDYVGAGKRALELGVDLVPPEALRDHLTASGVALANQAADALENLKVGPAK